MKQTTKSLIGLLALAVVAIAIAFGAAWAGKDEEKKAAAKEQNEKLFDGFDKAHARGLRVARDGKTAVALSRADEKSGWKMTEPVQADADDNYIDSLLVAFGNLKQKSDLGDEKDGKKFGLEKPSLTVAVKLDDGKELGVDFGIENTFDNTVYSRKLGESTIRVEANFEKGQFDKPPFEFRDKRVAHLADGAEVKRLEVSATKTPFVLEKDSAKWKVSGEPADTAEAERLVTTVKNLRATGIAAESMTMPAQFGLDLPKAVVKISTADGARTLSFGQLAAGTGQVNASTYAKRDDSPVVYQIDGTILQDLTKNAAAFEDKSLASFDRDAVRKLVLESPAGRVEISRTRMAPDAGTTEEFEVLAPAKGHAKRWKLSAVLYSLASLKAQSFSGAVPKDTGKFNRSVSLLGEGDKLLYRLRVGEEKDGKLAVIPEGASKVALVDRGNLADLPWNASDALDLPSTDGGVDGTAQNH